ncbi:MAG TPA: FAD-binding oxidoreductase [Tepidisphaeraceae bacterium]|jgi:4-cresol dehydrogenase (hydroxylating)
MSNALLNKDRAIPLREAPRPPVDATASVPADFAAAAREWAAALGEGGIETGEQALARYARTTATTSNRPLAILFPTSTAHVQRALQIASAYGIGVHPISRGKNWGYGDACPPGPNQVVMDLGRMNRILEVNAELCYAVIEPGVTQEQLYRYLKDHQIPLWMDSSGAGREASLVGNILERGFGHTRYGDRILSVCGMEVVLGDGRILNTGFGHYPNAKSHRTYRYGIGPFLDGIFSQSNYGVVTRMGIWLMPQPQDFCAFFFSGQSDADLPAIIDALAPLRMQGILQSTIHVANDLRTISGRMGYPWDRAGGVTPLPQALRAELRREFMIGAWNGCGALYGTCETVAAARKVMARAMRLFKPRFLNDRTLKTATRLQRALCWTDWGRRMGERLQVVEPVYGLLKGIPTDEPLRGAAWRIRPPAPNAPTDPLDCHAGLTWIAPTLPASGRAAQDLMHLLEPIYACHGFDTLVTFTLITERALCCVTNIAFDRRESEEAKRANACCEDLTDVLLREGYISYRAGARGMAKLTAEPSTFWDVAGQIKRVLDPAGIVSPGKYLPAA